MNLRRDQLYHFQLKNSTVCSPWFLIERPTCILHNFDVFLWSRSSDSDRDSALRMEQKNNVDVGDKRIQGIKGSRSTFVWFRPQMKHRNLAQKNQYSLIRINMEKISLQVRASILTSNLWVPIFSFACSLLPAIPHALPSARFPVVSSRVSDTGPSDSILFAP